MPPATFHLQFETRSDFGYLPFLTRIFKRLGVRKAPVLTQILVEAYNNAVVHGNKRNKEKWVGVDILLTAKQARVRISDEGRGTRLRPFGATAWQARDRKLWLAKGRGLQLIRALAKQVTSRKKEGRHIFEATV